MSDTTMQLKSGVDWLDRRAEQLSPQQKTADEMHLNCIALADFLRLDIPPRRMLLDPWLPAAGLAMLYAPRGVGKSWLALSIGYAIAGGGTFLGWEAPSPVSVLFLDGEMPAVAMQERLATIVKSADFEAEPATLQLLTPDLQPTGMPDLSTLEGQMAVQPFVDSAQLIIVDNIATLCRSGKENEGESWLRVQEWALRLRAQGKSVLFVHHAGKGGQQRGTSRREDVLDTVIALRYPKAGDDETDNGARFELHFEKNRGFFGEDADSRVVQLISDEDSSIRWIWEPLKESTFHRVVELLKDGLTPTEAAKELEIHKSTATRYKQRAEREGLLTPKSGK